MLFLSSNKRFSGFKSRWLKSKKKVISKLIRLVSFKSLNSFCFFEIEIIAVLIYLCLLRETDDGNVVKRRGRHYYRLGERL